MKRVISSGWTIVFKLFVPLLLILLSIVLVVGLFAYPRQPPRDALIGTLLTIVATAFFSWWGARLKVVRVDEKNLYASNWRKEISIPFAEIDDVDAVQGGWPVNVRLKARSEFGPTIRFLAPWQPLLFSKDHPILEELKELMKQA